MNAGQYDNNRMIKEYEIRLADGDMHEIIMPVGAYVRSVTKQGMSEEYISMWVEIDKRNEGTSMTTRRFYLCMKNNPVPMGAWMFIGSVPFQKGTYVYHVYESI